MEEEKLEIEGYKPLRNDRNKDGGGIYIGILERLEYIYIQW